MGARFCRKFRSKLCLTWVSVSSNGRVNRIRLSACVRLMVRVPRWAGSRWRKLRLVLIRKWRRLMILVTPTRLGPFKVTRARLVLLLTVRVRSVARLIRLRCWPTRCYGRGRLNWRKTLTRFRFRVANRLMVKVRLVVMATGLVGIPRGRVVLAKWKVVRLFAARKPITRVLNAKSVKLWLKFLRYNRRIRVCNSASRKMAVNTRVARRRMKCASKANRKFSRLLVKLRSNNRCRVVCALMKSLVNRLSNVCRNMKIPVKCVRNRRKCLM